MNIKNIKLEELSTEELEALKTEIERLLKERANANKNAYEIEVSITADPRKWKPYIAKLVIDSNTAKLVREFYELPRTYGKHSITIFGKIQAKDGDVIEIREGGSWQNEYRYAYIVKGGKLVKICDHRDSKCYSNIVKYLLGELEENNLIKKTSEIPLE